MIPNLNVSNNGSISLFVKDTIIEMTIDGAIHVRNVQYNMTFAISNTGESALMYHSNGNICSFKSRISILAKNLKGNRMAKIWHKGITFMTAERPIIYLLDAGGVKTTSDWFIVMDDYCPAKIFCFKSLYGREYINDAVSMLYHSVFWINYMGEKNWKIGDLRISETTDGLLRIQNVLNMSRISINYNYGSASLNTPYLHCTASLGVNGHLFVRCGNCRMHYDGKMFIVRNEGQAAAIDHENKIKIL